MTSDILNAFHTNLISEKLTTSPKNIDGNRMEFVSGQWHFMATTEQKDGGRFVEFKLHGGPTGSEKKHILTWKFSAKFPHNEERHFHPSNPTIVELIAKLSKAAKDAGAGEVFDPYV